MATVLSFKIIFCSFQTHNICKPQKEKLPWKTSDSSVNSGFLKWNSCTVAAPQQAVARWRER